MKIIIILVGAACFLTSLTFAAYVPEVKRNTAQFFQGHNAETDESTGECVLDLALLNNAPEEITALLVFRGDWQSKLQFPVAVPTKLLPLIEGSTWQDYRGNSFRYVGGNILGENIESNFGKFNVQIKISADLEKVEKATAQKNVRDGFANTYLNCEF